VNAVDVIFKKDNGLRKTLETLKEDPCIPSDTKASIHGSLPRQLSSLFNFDMTRKRLVLLETF